MIKQLLEALHLRKSYVCKLPIEPITSKSNKGIAAEINVNNNNDDIPTKSGHIFELKEGLFHSFANSEGISYIHYKLFIYFQLDHKAWKPMVEVQSLNTYFKDLNTLLKIIGI